jgi:hypothetical protein
MTAKPPFGPDKPVAVVPTGPESDADTEFEATGDAETAAPIEPREFDEAHQALVSDDSIQFDLPMFEPPPETPPPEWLQWLVGFLSTDHPVLRGLLWALLGAAVLLILWLVIRRLSGADWPWRRRAATDADEETWRPAEAPARALLGEADALANRGLFAEAVHLLLFRSIADLDERKPGLVRPALTSRDIAGLGDIPSGPRGAFARIAMLVEQSLFARRPLAEGDWTSCRAAYEEFAFAESWRG